jgi:hypothetical protein
LNKRLIKWDDFDIPGCIETGHNGTSLAAIEDGIEDLHRVDMADLRQLIEGVSSD